MFRYIAVLLIAGLTSSACMAERLKIEQAEIDKIFAQPPKPNEKCSVSNLVGLQELGKPVVGPGIPPKERQHFYRRVRRDDPASPLWIHAPTYDMMIDLRKKELWVLQFGGGYVDHSEWFGPFAVDQAAMDECL